MTCRRNYTNEQILAGLKAGRVLIQDRRDAPEYEYLCELERQGLVDKQLIIIDEQSSVLRWWWKGDKA